jgi:hypothetical protein
MFINLNDIEKLTSEQLNKLYERNFSNSLFDFFKLGNLVVHYERASGIKVWDKEDKNIWILWVVLVP